MLDEFFDDGINPQHDLEAACVRRKRAAVAPSCTELVWDELFAGAWLARKRNADTDYNNAM